MSLVLEETDPSTGLHWLTLNRVDKLNALSRALLADLIRTVGRVNEAALAREIRAVGIRSAVPKAFCTGADLAERGKMTTEETSHVLGELRQTMDSIAALPVPTFAIVEGAAFGGGLELALACDFRLASPAASLGLVETRWAIIPGAGGTQRLSRLLGVSRAKELIFRGLRLSGAEAHRLGLVDDCAENPQALALAWARDIAEGGPIAMGAAKRAIDGGLDLPLEQGLSLERECYETVLHTEDRREGLRAFAEKRKPIYKGI
jgi:methylglutaconyl-CoA hydratase